MLEPQVSWPIQIFILHHPIRDLIAQDHGICLLHQWLTFFTQKIFTQHPVSSLISTLFTDALCAALLLVWIWWTYSATMTWNLGASLLDEAALRPAFFRALLTCLSAFWKWIGQREGTVDLSIGFPQRTGPAWTLNRSNHRIRRKFIIHRRYLPQQILNKMLSKTEQKIYIGYIKGTPIPKTTTAETREKTQNYKKAHGSPTLFIYFFPFSSVCIGTWIWNLP